MREHERDGERVYGLNAALAVFATRPDDIVRIHHTKDVRREIAPMLRAAASRRVPYNEVGADELARIADAVHHEGICLLTRPRTTPRLEALPALLRRGRTRAALALDGVVNPHNVGAVLRSAAYFGIDALIVASESANALTPSAVRIAEGGAEHVPCVTVRALAPALASLRSAGVHIVGTDVHGGRAVWQMTWPKPCVLVLGSERVGVSRAVTATCEAMVQIPGAGLVESLNVSVAAGVLLAAIAATR